MSIISLYQHVFLMAIIHIQQQVQGLSKLNYDEYPWQAVIMDLANDLQKWQEDGKKLFLMTDFNEDVCLPWIKNIFAKLGMYEVTMRMAGPFAMAILNRGWVPIYGILVSQNLLDMWKGGI